jgi:hypothetical protein
MLNSFPLPAHQQQNRQQSKRSVPESPLRKQRAFLLQPVNVIARAEDRAGADPVRTTVSP